MKKNKNKYNQKGGNAGLFDRIDGLFFNLIKKFENFYKNSYSEFIRDKFNLIINVILFFLIISFIIVVVLFMLNIWNGIFGWWIFFWFLIYVSFILKLSNTLYIFFNSTSTKKFDSSEIGNKDVFNYFNNVFENFTSSIPLVILFSFLFSSIKIIPTAKESFAYIFLTILLIIFLLYGLFSVFLKGLFKLSHVDISKVSLYLFIYLFFIYAFIYLLSLPTNHFLNSLFTKVKKKYKNEYYSNDNELAISKAIEQTYVNFSDKTDSMDSEDHNYLGAIIYIIIYLLLSFFVIYLSNNPIIVKGFEKYLKIISTSISNFLKLNKSNVGGNSGNSGSSS